MARSINLDGFENLFQCDPDPWDYETSAFEAHKRSVLLRHAGLSPRGRVLELACANGVTTQALMNVGLRVTALDGSLTAISQAQARLGKISRLRLLHANLPEGMPKERFDLIVVSEIVYYLGSIAARQLAKSVANRVSPGGRVVVLHHHVNFPDASVNPEHAHRDFVRLLRKRMTLVRSARTGRFCVAALVAGHRH
ncbi:class I SAM-dependent DNA methyltransferase [Georhizobium sp. MAB10]|uniref:class I SAM-dependent DNA methyltransferase n=1 Tax=Georhizobium sp. MAB10 TaxID=3028319 RepID=UPI003855DCE0